MAVLPTGGGALSRVPRIQARGCDTAKVAVPAGEVDPLDGRTLTSRSPARVAPTGSSVVPVVSPPCSSRGSRRLGGNRTSASSIPALKTCTGSAMPTTMPCSPVAPCDGRQQPTSGTGKGETMSTNSTANDEDRDPGTRSEAGLPVVRLIRTARGGIGAAWRGRHRPKRGGPGMWSGLVLTMLSVVLLATPPARAQQCAPPTVSVERLGGEQVVARGNLGRRFDLREPETPLRNLQFRIQADVERLECATFQIGCVVVASQ